MGPYKGYDGWRDDPREYYKEGWIPFEEGITVEGCVIADFDTDLPSLSFSCAIGYIKDGDFTRESTGELYTLKPKRYYIYGR